MWLLKELKYEEEGLFIIIAVKVFCVFQRILFAEYEKTS